MNWVKSHYSYQCIKLFSFCSSTYFKENVSTLAVIFNLSQPLLLPGKTDQRYSLVITHKQLLVKLNSLNCIQQSYTVCCTFYKCILKIIVSQHKTNKFITITIWANMIKPSNCSLHIGWWEIKVN